MLLVIPLLASILMICIITYQKRNGITNQCLLLVVLTISTLYLAFQTPFDVSTEIFVLTAAAVIIPPIAVIVFIINHFSSKKTENVNDYKGEIKRKLFHFIGFLVFIPPSIVWLSYISAIYGFTAYQV